MAKKRVKKVKVKKEKHLLGKGEFVFNFLSLVLMIGMGVYFGYRSLYYYSKQNRQYQSESATLNGVILQNTKVVYEEEDGFHQDSLGYYYKGNVENNYVLFANRLYRILRIQEDHSVKVIADTNHAILPWGDFVSFREANLYYWLNLTNWEYSGYYYHTIPNVEDFLVKMKYQEKTLNEEQIVDTEETLEEYFSLPTIEDYVHANGMSSFLNNGKMFFLLGLNSEGQNLYVEEDGSIQLCDTTEGYGVRPVFTFKPNTPILGGDGTKENPYVIDQGDKKNYVASYAKFGDDLWQVFYQDGNILKLYLVGYIMENNEEKVIPYSQTNSIYDIMDAENVGYYLNHAYYDNLPYQNILIPFNSLTGEISDDQGYQYAAIYKNMVSSQVSLLNVFDPVFEDSLSDFYRVNNTSPIGSMEYVTYSSGLLGEADVREGKHIVPVISITNDILKNGTGEKNNPYKMG